MKIYNKDLKRARRWLAAGHSSKVIHFLEPKVPIFLEDVHYYVLLGRACMETGLLTDADTYLNRGIQADPENIDVYLTLAVNHLKRKDPAAAVRTWLEIIDDFPEHKDIRYARKGLKSLKKISDEQQQDRFLDRFDARKYLPYIGSRWPGRILIVLLIVLAGLTAFYFKDEALSFFSSASVRDYRTGAENFLPGSGRSLTESGGDILYPMSDQELSRTLRKALRFYQNYDDNKARYELNKIRYSNAAEDIRQKAIGLIDALGEPDIETIGTDYSYADVASAPWLYDGCWVKWTGMTANVVFRDDAILFDFLVGFEDGKVLEGKVPVEIPFTAVIEPLPLELLAQVEPRDGSFILVGKTLHFLR
jgi:tetratricopeptide (TPR) repeat protein